MNIPLSIVRGRFPSNYSAGPVVFFQDYMRRLRIKIPQNQVLVGFVGPLKPTYDRGPWLKVPASGSWQLYYWDKSLGKYLPMLPQLGTGNYKVSFVIGSSAGPNDGTGIRLQDIANGVAATDLDLYVPRATHVETSTSATILFAGASYDNVIHRLTRATTYSLNLLEGQTMTLAVQNRGTSFTLNWSGVKWKDVAVGGSPPVMPSATAGHTVTALFQVTRINNLLYGEYMGQYSTLPVTSVAVGGPSNNLGYNPSGYTVLGGGQNLLLP